MIGMSERRNWIAASVSRSIASRLRFAADLLGISLDEFLVKAALEKASEVIEREQTIRFSQEDAALFLSMLDAPLENNQTLVKAFERRSITCYAK